MAYFGIAAGAGVGLSAVILTLMVWQVAQVDRSIVWLIVGGTLVTVPTVFMFIANACENASIAIRAGQLGAGAARGQAPDVIDVQARQARADLDAERAAWYGRKDRPRALPVWATGGADDDDGEVVL